MFSVYAKLKNAEESAAMVRPSELPIYDEPGTTNEYDFYERPAGWLQQSVGDLRSSLTDFLVQYKDTYDYAQHVVETGKAHTAATLEYLKDETNLVPRATAITVGGLTGLLVAAVRRRGLVKRLLYTGVGLAVPTAICYPQQTAAYGRWGLDESQKYGMVAYNFLIGAKPDDAARPQPPTLVVKPPPAEKEEARAQPPDLIVHPAPAEKEEAKAQPPPPPPPPPPPAPVQVAIVPVVDDPGQSNPEDADLYTTRSG